MPPKETTAQVVFTLGLVAALAGCGPQIELETGDATLGSGSSSSAGPGTTPVTVSTTSSTTTSADSTGTTMTPSSTGTDASTSIGFIMDPDGGGVAYGECDVFAQDCPEGEKCQPWSNDGTDRWNATRCSRIEPMPDQPGDPCTAEGSPFSGIDTCDEAVLCFDVDPKTLEGTCYEMCSGDQSSPTCSDEARVCTMGYEGTIALCVLPCDPVAQDCPDDLSCAWDGEQFVCLPAGDGAYGDACEQVLDCAAGLSCVQDATVGCAGRCCTDACDPMMPACMDGTQTCHPFADAGLCGN